MSTFTPSNYETDFTMDGTAQSDALAEGVKKLQVVNKGATTEDVRVAFGTSSANAEANLNITTGAATQGFWIGAAADGYDADVIIGVPRSATHYALANGTAADTQTVSVAQGA